MKAASAAAAPIRSGDTDMPAGVSVTGPAYRVTGAADRLQEWAPPGAKYRDSNHAGHARSDGAEAIDRLNFSTVTRNSLILLDIR